MVPTGSRVSVHATRRCSFLGVFVLEKKGGYKDPAKPSSRGLALHFLYTSVSCPTSLLHVVIFAVCITFPVNVGADSDGNHMLPAKNRQFPLCNAL